MLLRGWMNECARACDVEVVERCVQAVAALWV